MPMCLSVLLCTTLFDLSSIFAEKESSSAMALVAVSNVAGGSKSSDLSSSPVFVLPVSFPLHTLPCSSSSSSVVWNSQKNFSCSLRIASFCRLYKGPGPRLESLNATRRRFIGSTLSKTLKPIRAAISVGEKLPDATLSYLDKDGELQTVTVSDLAKGKKIILFGVPGAFTPTCSQKHLPGFVEKADELKAKGVDTIACVSVNDAFVMKAWGENLNVGDKVLLLADGNGVFTKALGVTVDLSDKPAGLGVRSRRYALLAEDGVVKVFNLEEGGAFTISSAEDILKVL